MRDEPTILVVDDNEDLLETFARILKRRGFSVETAENGATAVAKFRDNCYDITLMDIVMPGMNGVEALRQIKEIQPDAFIVLMTAYSDEELLRSAREEGVNKVINKPIKVDFLFELISGLDETECILVVDDDPDICDMLSRVFQKEGHDVVTASSGEEAIMVAREKSCQMAFIDMKLPNIDGLETFLRIKEINPDIITIMMTGFHNEVREALETARAASAVTCLYKPFSPVEATELVQKMGKKTKRRGRTDGR